jgi:hypothetical protein
MTGNPVAPLFNRWFPNPWFHPSMEEELSKLVTSFGVSPWRIPIELATGGHLHGIYGPLVLAIPAGLVALRRQAGLRCWLAAGALSVPWLWNHDARFLMSTVALGWMALAMVLPARVAVLGLALHAVTSWPHVVNQYSPERIFRLEEFPWRAALRIESDEAYLSRQLENYPLARLIQQKTSPEDQVFILAAVPWAYTDRRVLEYWYSSQGDRMLDWLKTAGLYTDEPVYDVNASWAPQLVRALRFRLSAGYPKDWDLQEIRLWSGGERIRGSGNWSLSGWPNVWEMPYALDDNSGTLWRTWTPMRAGMYVQIDLNQPLRLSGATLVSRAPRFGVPVEFFGMDAAGHWQSLGAGHAAGRIVEDVRRPAMRAIRREGFQYLVASPEGEGLGKLGKVIAGHEAEWGLESVGEAAGAHLYRIR